MTRWKMPFQRELIEQRSRFDLPMSHHERQSCASTRLNHSCSCVATPFFNTIDHKQTHAVQRKTNPRGQLYIRLPTASTRTCASHKSKIGGDQLVRPFATAPIDLGGNCMNQVAV